VEAMMSKSLKLFVSTMTVALARSALACPMCKDSIPTSDAAASGSLPGGFNFSVYYMLIGLFVTLALVTGVIVKGVRSTPVALRTLPRK
jgi:hypothetical protein